MSDNSHTSDPESVEDQDQNDVEDSSATTKADTSAGAKNTSQKSTKKHGSGPMRTQNDIVRGATREYIETLDPLNPPSPEKIEAELLHAVNSEIMLHNHERDKSEKMGTLKTLTFAQIAQILMHLHRICRIGPSGKNTDREYDLVAMYQATGEDRGIYVTSEDAFRSVARKYNYSLTTADFKEVMAALKDEAPRAYRCLQPDLIAVNNGIFNYATKTLEPFTPDKVFLSKSQVDYVPGAPNVVIHNDEDGTDWDVESWMAELSDDPEVVDLLWQILGAIIRPNVRWNKSAWLYSEQGNNGKGTLCELMRNLTGPTSYASIPIADFSKDFLLEPLTRASAIIVDENDVGSYVDRAANLKAVITNDVISINRKFKSPIAYQFFGFMVQCLNEFPRIKDKSESFYRRQLFIPMEKNFKGVERRYIKDDYLHRPEVLQYVMHRVLHMNYYVLSEPAATKRVLDSYRIANDPVRQFWDELADDFVWDLLPLPFLYDLYRAWFVRNNPSGSALGKQTFNLEITKIAQEGGHWYKADKVRPGKRMNTAETLIAKYDLKDWFNPGYSGPDVLRKCLPPLSTTYAGLIRSSSGPTAVIATSQKDDDEDDRTGTAGP